MQSITWEAMRGLFPAKWKQKKNVAAADLIWNNYRSGEITVEQAQELINQFLDGAEGRMLLDEVINSIDHPVIRQRIQEDPEILLLPRQQSVYDSLRHSVMVDASLTAMDETGARMSRDEAEAIAEPVIEEYRSFLEGPEMAPIRARVAEAYKGHGAELIKAKEDPSLLPPSGWDFYQALAGEIEARLTERRWRMNEAQRREITPWQSDRNMAGEEGRVLQNPIVTPLGLKTKSPYAASLRRELFQGPASKVADAVSLEAAFRLAGGQRFRNNRSLKVALQERHLSTGVDLATPTQEADARLVNLVINDAVYALRDNAGAVGWYNEKVRIALEVLALVHPELATDPQARFAFTWILAATSNGLKVDANFKTAERVYRHFKKTGVMPTNVKAGKAQGAINEGLRLYNKLSARFDFESLQKFMVTRMSPAEVKAITGITLTGEEASGQVRGAAILGSKIGNGFFSNLYGIFNELTIDRWLMRTWGRMTGTLIDERPDMVNKKTAELRRVLSDVLSDPARAKALNEIMGRRVLKKELTSAGLQSLAFEIQKVSTKKEAREALNRVSEDVRKVGNSLAGYIDGQKEQPSGGKERTRMRQVFEKALRQLQTRPDLTELTMADLQALLWYPEKRLYDAAKSKEDEASEGYDDDEAPDYANAAIKLARERGVSEPRLRSVVDGAGAGRPEPSASDEGGAEAGTVSRGGEGFDRRSLRDFGRRAVLHRVRRGQLSGRGRSGADGGSPRPYARRGSGSVKGLRDVVAVYSADRTIANALGLFERKMPKLIELDPARHADHFHAQISKAKASNRFGAAVHVYDVADYADMRLFQTEDGSAGFALKDAGDGVVDIVSVFSDGSVKGAVDGMMMLAVQEGGNKLDAFDTALPRIYGPFGFRPVARMRWNDEFAPEGWDKDTFVKFNGGEPDVVFMALDENYFAVPRSEEAELFTDYDAAVAAQEAAVKGQGPDLDGEADFNEGGRELDQAARGSITIPNAGLFSNEDVVIRLGRQTDASTFMHESAHLFLELYRELAEDSQVIRAEYDQIREWLGVGDGEPITRDQHEMFAEGFEAYLKEGRAPVSGLEAAFEAFAKWLSKIYRSMRIGRRLNLDPEGRRVMDRLFLVPQSERTLGRSKRKAYTPPVGGRSRGVAIPAGEGQDVDAIAIRDLVKDLTRALGVAVNEGRLEVRGADGEFHERTSEIRLRLGEDFTTLVHEAGHLLAARYPAAYRAVEAEARQEIMKLNAGVHAPVGQEFDEAFAEMVRIFVEGPAYLANETPNALAAFVREFTKADPLMMEALQDLSIRYNSYMTQSSERAISGHISKTGVRDGIGGVIDNVKRARERFGHNTPTIVADFLTGFYAGMFDKTAPIYRVQADLASMHQRNHGKNYNFTPSKDFSRLARLSADGHQAGLVDIMSGVVPYKSLQASGASLGAALEMALGKNTLTEWNERNMQDFGSYLVSRRMVEEYRRYNDGELRQAPDLFTLEEHLQNIRDKEAANPGYRRAAEMINEWNQNLLRKKLDAGFITQDQFDRFTTARNFYVPVLRDRDATRDRSSGIDSMGRSDRQNKDNRIRPFKGSQRAIINPIESMIRDAYQTNMAVWRNETIGALLKMAEAVGPGSSEILTEVPKSVTVARQVDAASAFRVAAQRAGVDEQDAAMVVGSMEEVLDGQTMAIIYGAKEAPEMGDQILYYWDKGERRSLKLHDDPRGRMLWDALVGLGKDRHHWLVELVSLPTRLLTQTITGHPVFPAINWLRDQMSTAALSGNSYTPGVSGLQGAATLLGDKKTVDEYMVAGGHMGGINASIADRNRRTVDINDLRRNRGVREQLS